MQAQDVAFRTRDAQHEAELKVKRQDEAREGEEARKRTGKEA